MASGTGRVAGWVLGSLLAGLHTTAAAQSVVVVHLESAAGAPAANVDAMKGEVERVFKGASITLDWAPALYRPIGDLPCDGRRHVAVSLVNIEAPFTRGAAAAGENEVAGRAAVDLQRAWVFPNRIQGIGDRRPVDTILLVARAMAHEIGHLLLPPGRGHGRAGVMRAGLELERAGFFQFTESESSSMRAGLSAATSCASRK